MELHGQSAEQPPVLAKVWRSRALLLLLAVLSTALLMACSRGSYPLDFFQEMHYHQSYKVQEPPSPIRPGRLRPYHRQGRNVHTGAGTGTAKSCCHQPDNPRKWRSAFPSQLRRLSWLIGLGRWPHEEAAGRRRLRQRPGKPHSVRSNRGQARW